ncbi:hypothetical protein AYO47_00520 [Planctomyces sp. SCGC AG-212-M04]|nr:hypothetical protein AYO47_00520 [Planctomyces sp. SCGC AG-212-M04]
MDEVKELLRTEPMAERRSHRLAVRLLATESRFALGLALLASQGCHVSRAVVHQEPPAVPFMESQKLDVEKKLPSSDVLLTSGEEETRPSDLLAEADPVRVPPAPDAPDDVTPVQPNIVGRPPAAYTLNLSRVLQIADAQNPNVAQARERINEAYARVERAEVLWLPSVRAGVHYDHHEGPLQDAAGNIINVNKSTLYGGFGTNVTGAGTVGIPGLSAQFHTTDAIFQPKIAEHQATSRRFAATAVRNDTLRSTAVAYLELVRAEQTVAITEEAQVNTRHLSSLTESYARTGQGLRSDDERVRAELVQRQYDVIRQTEQIQVASARLAQLLHSDPSCLIGSNEPVVAPIEMFSEDCPDASLISNGLMRRPELAEQRYLVCEACERLNREKYAPLVPSVLLGLSYGGFGGGQGGTIANSSDRWDADAIAFWEVRNLGFGEKAARNEASSVARQAQWKQVALLDQVAREVTEAHAQVLQRKKRIALAQDGIIAAEKSLKLNLERIENAQGLPIEALQAVQALANARVAYLNAVVDYNIAQFELCRATGWFMQGGVRL